MELAECAALNSVPGETCGIAYCIEQGKSLSPCLGLSMQ